MSRKKVPNLIRLLALLDGTEEPDGCWNFLGTKDKKGYGKIWDNETNEMERVHRLMYKIFVGPLLPGMHIHHKCFNTGCGNYHHLEQKESKWNSGKKRKAA